jgi:two-component system chemotaxis response regulator CheB
MGCSTGGPKALLKLFSGLNSELDVPIFIVQHMPPMFTQTLAKSIDEISTFSVKEAEDGDKPLPNHAYIAPGGRQMKLVHGSAGIEIKITDDAPENFCKPSVDYFFNSVAEIYETRSLGVILSGMGSDGREGLKKMKQHGVTVLGQDEESCVVYGMPRVAQEAGLVDKQVSIERMASAIEGILKLSVKGFEAHAKD